MIITMSSDNRSTQVLCESGSHTTVTNLLCDQITGSEYLDVFSDAELNPKASQATKKVKKKP